MLSVFLTDNSTVSLREEILPGSWISLCAPTEDEISSVSKKLSVDADLIRAALDEEERARLEFEDGQVLLVVDTPIVELEGDGYVYTTLPLGIIMTEENIITVCLKEVPLLHHFTAGRVRSFSTKKKNRFVLQILYRNATLFLNYLRQIDKASVNVEGELHKSMKNKELIQMLKFEKSLVYFSTSLKGNEVVMERLLRTESLRRYPDDMELLEDVIVENKQAIEMCTIYRDILSGTMDAFASVISNNLNIVMKVLTSITIILAVPTLIASLWGMNVPMPFSNNPYGFWIVMGIAVVCAVVSTVVLLRRKML